MKKSVDALIQKIGAKPGDIEYAEPKRNISYLLVFGALFFVSLPGYVVSIGRDFPSASWVFGIILFISAAFFVYDFILKFFRAKKRFKKELIMLREILTYDDIRKTYKQHGHTKSDDALSGKSLQLWSWDLNFDMIARSAVLNYICEKFNIRRKIAIDLGCANGIVINAIKRQQNTLYGLDLDIKNLKAIGTDNGIPGKVVNAIVERLPLRGDVFDAVFFTEVIEHLPAPAEALNDIFRILKPGGILIITTPSRNHFLSWESLNPLMLIKQILGLLIDRCSSDKSLVSVWRGNCFYHTNFSFKEVICLLNESGLKVRYSGSYGFIGAAIRAFAKIKPANREVLKRLNELEREKNTAQEYLDSREKKYLIEKRYSRIVEKVNIFFQKAPLFRLGGSNLLIVAEKASESA